MSKEATARSAMKLALDALVYASSYCDTYDAITALREALTSVPDWASEALEQPARPYRQLQDNGSKYFGGSWDKAEQPAQQEPVAWPAGLIERITAAEQRIQDGHAPRRIPADPTDVDLVLAEVRYLLEGKQPPFWVSTSPPAQRKPLTDEDCTRIYNEANGITTKNPPITTERIFKAMRAAHGIKENT